MKESSISMMGSSATTAILGVLAGLLVLAVLNGWKVPFAGSARTALVILVVLGMAMCTSGIGRVAASGAWTHPLAVLGCLVGVMILVIAGASLLGKPLPLIHTSQQAILAVAGLAVVKLALSALHRVLM